MSRLADYDLADLDLFEDGFPHRIFELHRREAPVYWHPKTEHTPDGVGFWSVATYPETLEIMRDAEVFSSVGGGDRPDGGTLLPDNVAAGRALNMMDDPRHQRVRRLVSHGFTPKTITRLERELRTRTGNILDRIGSAGRSDFVIDVAGELPLQAITILMGVPERDRYDLFEWVDFAFDFRGREAFEDTEESQRAWAALLEYGTRLIAERRARPTDDMFSAVVNAELAEEDPPRLTDEELYAFFFLLFAAGSDTTRNAAAGGMLALIQNPAQLDELAANLELLPKAIEEMVRWTSPAAYNRRTATRDVDFRGHRIRAGDKVVFWEASANRDENVFPRSMHFDIRRQPNPHLGFGHGIHHCLGANLARLEMTVIFEECLRRFRSIELAAPPEWTRSNKHTGLRHLPIRFTLRERDRDSKV